jgi:hypothetical protein
MKVTKGQILICIINTRASDYLTVGNEYVVYKDSESGNVTTIDDDGDNCMYSLYRFITAADFRIMKINNIIS